MKRFDNIAQAERSESHAESAKGRFGEACKRRGLAEGDVMRIGLAPGGQDVLFAIAKEAGVTREDHEAWFNRPHIHTSRLACVGGLAGCTIGAAISPIAQLMSKGRVSWRTITASTPKAVGIGTAAGAFVMAAGSMHVNNRNDWLRDAANDHWDEQEARWAKKEAESRAAASLTCPKMER